MILRSRILLLLIYLCQTHSSKEDNQCSDEYPDICEARVAAGDCYGGSRHETIVALRAMVNCRASCKEYFRKVGAENIPQVVTTMGGVEDTITDVLGVKLDICNLEDGFNRDVRYSMLRHLLVAERQKSWLPAFTKEGFLIQNIPTQLFGMLKMSRIRTEESPEYCHPKIAATNCQVRSYVSFMLTFLFTHRNSWKMLKMNVKMWEMIKHS